LITDILGNTVWKLDQERNIKTDMDLAQQNVTCLLTHFLILMREIPGKTTLVSPLKILSLKPQNMVVSKLCNLWVQLLKQIHKYYIYIYLVLKDLADLIFLIIQ
jgi:hypothetical protein